MAAFRLRIQPVESATLMRRSTFDLRLAAGSSQAVEWTFRKSSWRSIFRPFRTSLGYLHRLPIDELKLDRGFVQDLEDSETARALIASVLRIGESLRMKGRRGAKPRRNASSLSNAAVPSCRAICSLDPCRRMHSKTGRRLARCRLIILQAWRIICFCSKSVPDCIWLRASPRLQS
jgi:hypothetical protein